MATYALDFEKPLLELETKLAELKRHAATGTGSASAGSLDGEIRRLEKRCARLQQEIFNELSRWQVVQLSRHPNRPYTLDYIGFLFEDFVELHGDRSFADDQSIVAGLARFHGRSVVVLGHQKGRGAKENVKRNFGMPHPEGYRKARRIYELAARFGLPIMTFIDTPGAYPGLGAEERGQSEAIGACLAAMARAPVPIIATIIGEGGSGGALALGVANRVHVLEYGTYSVISPEGCASILWKDGAKADEAALRLKITAPELLGLKIVDKVLEEPAGGAHQDPRLAAKLVDAAMSEALGQLLQLTPDELVRDRYDRFRALGAFVA
ncbi:MAG: acetyl-CoA carboxylase carboxyltransferase subunit alpha [Myxococcales bacterium]